MMARVHVTGGYLNVEGMSGGYPGNELPGVEGPVDPGFGIEAGGGHPWVPGHLPSPPPGVFPPLVPSHPIQPAPPGTPPGVIWPPLFGPVDPSYGHGGVVPPHPSGQPVPGGGRPDNALPGGGGGQIDNALPSKTYWVVVGIPGVGWRYIACDPSLVAGMPLPPAPQPK